jgi:hypothetical protein
MITNVPKDEIERYVATGEHDDTIRKWPGENVLDRINRGSRILIEALIAQVRRLEAEVELPQVNVPSGPQLLLFARESSRWFVDFSSVPSSRPWYLLKNQ